jgi:hypothetical protein
MRHARRLLAALLVSACLAEYRLPPAEPKCDPRCLAETECIEGTCVRSCADECDPFREECGDEELCECRHGLTACAGYCVDLERDDYHCGECFARCAADRSCGGGECLASTCEGFPDACEGTCTDFDTDVLNCGGCDRPCFEDELCIEGRCVPVEVLDPSICDGCPCPACEDEGGICCIDEAEEEILCVYFDVCP